MRSSDSCPLPQPTSAPLLQPCRSHRSPLTARQGRPGLRQQPRAAPDPGLWEAGSGNQEVTEKWSGGGAGHAQKAGLCNDPPSGRGLVARPSLNQQSCTWLGLVDNPTGTTKTVGVSWRRVKLALRFPHAVLPARILSLRLHPFHVFFVLCLRQDLTVHTWLAWNWHRTHRDLPACVCLPSAANKGMCHHTQP